MRSPTLNELPPPPPGKTGWPWNEESPAVSEAMADGSPWPRVTIVTPSYNQGQFIEETIRSVLLQGYPNLEYIIMDGGSSDGSVDIIRKYDPWLAYWVSEPDRGQSHAVNKGWERATGEIWAWLNSDDLYLPGAIGRAVEALWNNPGNALVHSDVICIDETSLCMKPYRSGPIDAKELLMGNNGRHILQPTVFIRRVALWAVGGLDESLHMAMDLDLWIKLALSYRLGYLEGQPLAISRYQPLQKTNTMKLEGLICSLAVLERGLQNPLCPAGITYRGNNAYAQACLEMAIYYMSYKNYKNSLSYFGSAWKSQPVKTMHRLANKGVVGLYRWMMPQAIQRFIACLRGTENQGWLIRDAGH